ncbi:polyubiquitin [Penicillium herquei]|nr:polyubiquitin [Penicillium herquei]
MRGGGKPVPTKLMLGEAAIFHGDAFTVVDLKRYVSESLGLFPDSQVISLNGNPLPDDAELHNYTESTESDLILKLSVQAPKSKILGIGAGGNIIQDIYRDTSDARLWDVGNSKILNIHTINASSFEEFTSMIPSRLKKEEVSRQPESHIRDLASGDTYLDLDHLDADIQAPLAVPVALLEVDQTLPWFHGIS